MKNKSRVAVALLMVIYLCVSLFPVTAFAGTSKTTIDNSTFAEKINNAVWNNVNGDVVAQDGKLIFPATSTADTRLISKTAVSKNDVTENMFHAKYKLNLINIPEGEAVILAFGLRSIESMPGEKGNIEVALTNQKGIKASVSAFETADTPTVLTEEQAVKGSEISVEVLLTQAQQLTVKVNGKTLYNGKITLTGEGRIGFLQTGSCHMEIRDLWITTYDYSRPENTNVSENFDNGTMDTSKLSCAMVKDFGYYPCRISVEEYNGNNMMMFQNSGLGYIGTKYQYSNFELTFDIPYLQRTEIYTEDYEVQTPKSSWFGISFGDEYMDSTWYDYDYKSPYMIYFSEQSSVIDFKNNFKVLADLSKSNHAFFAEGEKRGFSVKFSVIDARVSIGIKWMEEKEFRSVCEYDIANGQTPTGYIHIWSSEPNNFAIDNIVITNKDKDPMLIETEYKAGTVIVPEDYDFTRAEMVFKDENKADGAQDNSNFNWYLLIPCAALVSGLVIVVSVLIVFLRKRKEGV